MQAGRLDLEVEGRAVRDQRPTELVQDLQADPVAAERIGVVQLRGDAGEDDPDDVVEAHALPVVDEQELAARLTPSEREPKLCRPLVVGVLEDLDQAVRGVGVLGLQRAEEALKDPLAHSAEARLLQALDLVERRLRELLREALDRAGVLLGIQQEQRRLAAALCFVFYADAGAPRLVHSCCPSRSPQTRGAQRRYVRSIGSAR